MLPSLLLSVVSQDGIESAFAIGFGATLAAGVLLWLPNRLRRRDLNIRDGFLVTALFWIVLGLFGALGRLALPTRCILLMLRSA